MKNYCVVTYGNKSYCMTEDECETFANAFANPDNAVIPLPNGNLIAKGDVRYIGNIIEAPETKDKNYIPAEQKGTFLPSPHEDIGYLQILTTGEAKTGSKEFKMRIKKMWFEHVKRRPTINKLAREKREAAWKHHLSRFSPEERAAMQMPRGYLEPEYSKEELKIINTPLEVLLADYEKALT